VLLNGVSQFWQSFSENASLLVFALSLLFCLWCFQIWYFICLFVSW